VYCFCGRPARESGLCEYHDPQCVKDPKCRAKLVFTPHCEKCHLPWGEASGVTPRLREAHIHGPLVVETVVGDVELEGARGVDVYIYSVRGVVDMRGAKFRHVYVDGVVGGVEMVGARVESAVVVDVLGGVNLDGASAGGHVYVGGVSSLSARGTSVAGELVVERAKGGVVVAGARAYSLAVYKAGGVVDLSNVVVEGDVFIVEAVGDRLDLSGAEVGGRVYILESRFGGVRVDRADLIKRIVVL